MGLAANKAVVQRFYEQVINRRQLDAIATWLAPDFRHNGEPGGADGQRQAITALLAAFPDLRVVVEAVVAEGASVAVRCTWPGTQQGPFRGIAATGRRVSFLAIGILRLREGRIAEAWLSEDDLGLLRQLGARSLPPP